VNFIIIIIIIIIIIVVVVVVVVNEHPNKCRIGAEYKYANLILKNRL